MIYFDNAATTYPKPASVKKAVNNAIKQYGFNSGRGGYSQSIKTAQAIFSVREKLASMLSVPSQNIIFTPSCTLALNMAIKGSVKKGDHVIISALEHNAVARPIYSLAEKGVITYDIAVPGRDDAQTVANFSKLIKKETSLIVCTHASNVFGWVMPIREIGSLCREKGIRFVVDAAQSLGTLSVNCKRDNIDILCAPGHKGLYGPMGIGFMAISDGVKLDTIIEGGTGSASMRLEQPDFTPDRFEPGTLNNSGIIGLGAGVDFVNSIGVDKIYHHELGLISAVYSALEKTNDVTLYTQSPSKGRSAAIISFNYRDYPSEKTADLLAKHGIAVRAGLHCALPAHRFFGTAERGTVRVSPSVFTTQRECEIFINTLKKL